VTYHEAERGLEPLFLHHRHFELTSKAIEWPDALGLGLFAVAGVHETLLLGLPPVVAVLMGVLTAVFGGVLRDLVCNEIPTAFQDHRPYAICAFVGGWLYVALRKGNFPGWVVLVACVGVTAGLGGIALWRDWELPAWRD
jgi:uncharacterized membrane protein YeiH